MMMMKGGGSGSARGNGNPGEKPLEELSHQDIMQLTREDCRRYLKEKGMRRPSWNKSQAIQQVLSLKNLFHSTPEEPPLQGELGEGEAPPLPLPLPLPLLAELPVLATPNAPSTTTTRSGAQLTIFYSGNVNVYNDVPAEKAQAIMLLAAAANHLPLPNTQDAPSLATTSQLHKETPVTRKASLQRFLEKKKDRGRCKGGASASKKQPPMLMGMFMHPSYWSEAGKSKACTKPTHATAPSPSPSPSPSPTTPPHTPSSDEQRNSIILNSTQQPS